MKTTSPARRAGTCAPAAVIATGGSTMTMQTVFPLEPDATPTSRTARWLALGAVAGPILFALAWLVLGFLSPGYSIWGTWIAPYSPISQPISGLGLGVTAPFMNTAFVLSGLLIAVGMLGVFQSITELGPIARWTCTALLALSGVGAIGCGIFDLESFFPHFIGFLLAAGTPVPFFLVAGYVLRRVPRFQRLGSWLLLGSPLTLALLIVYFASFNQAAAGAGLGVAGLTQRILILEIHGWYAALGWSAFRGAEARFKSRASGR